MNSLIGLLLLKSGHEFFDSLLLSKGEHEFFDRPTIVKRWA